VSIAEENNFMNGTEAAEAAVSARKSRRVFFDIIPLYQLENLLVNVTADPCICKRFSGALQWYCLYLHVSARLDRQKRIMRYRRLGRTNLQISEIGRGLWGMIGCT